VKRAGIVVSVVAALVVVALLYLRQEDERERQFDAEIRAAARRYGVDPLLVKAIVWRESGFDPSVRGRAGELGLMQIQEIAAQEWADAERITSFKHSHCLDPATNTLAGTYYLSLLIKRYQHTDDPLPYALADYNAGRGNVIKWNNGRAATNSAAFIEQIGFPGTRAYVNTVLRRHSLYRFRARFGFE